MQSANVLFHSFIILLVFSFTLQPDTPLNEVCGQYSRQPSVILHGEHAYYRVEDSVFPSPVVLSAANSAHSLYNATKLYVTNLGKPPNPKFGQIGTLFVYGMCSYLVVGFHDHYRAFVLCREVSEICVVPISELSFRVPMISKPFNDFLLVKPKFRLCKY